jgi:tetratricopeptide (TPR) repeat protein
VYRSANEPEKASQALNTAIELDPSSPDAYGILGHLLLSQGKIAEAKKQYEETAKLRPTLVGPPTMLGLLNYTEGNRSEAKLWWEKAIAIDPDSVTASNNLAWLMAESGVGDLETALQLARRALQKYPDQPEFNDTVGWIYHLRKSPREAIWYLSQATEKAPDDPLYQFHLGTAYAQQGQDALARRHLQRVLVLDKNFPMAEQVRKTIATLIY